MIRRLAAAGHGAVPHVLAGLAVLLLGLPLVAGFAGTLVSALGRLPGANLDVAPLAPFAAVLGWPGLRQAALLALGTGLGATALAVAIALALMAGWEGTALARRIGRALAPLLAIPHAAAAFGLAVLLAPSGLLVRVLAPFFGLDRPPDILFPQDPGGLGLLLGLTLKELPFLLLMAAAARPQAARPGALETARALGYGRIAAWTVAVLPGLYRQIRLPIFAVIAYAVSVVDMALILGPTRPPPLAVLILDAATDPDLVRRTQAAAAALLLGGLVAGAILLWIATERGLARLGVALASAGIRMPRDGPLRLAGAAGTVGALALLAGSVAALSLWSVAWRWPFPALLPERWNADLWRSTAPDLAALAVTTLAIAAAATFLALVLALATLATPWGRRALPALVYAPLLMPQIVVLPGFQTLLLWIGLDGGAPAVLWGHLLFVLPYALLMLAGPWHAWDARLATVGAGLGAGPARIFWRLRLPMLAAPLLAAAAVAVAVSVAQFLPTLLLGAGRVQTLTTEAVALASGGDRRVIAVHALAQAGATVLPFLAALALPRLIWRNRRGLRG